MASDQKPVIAIAGGTGDLGTGLARRWATAGYKIIIGSRDLQKAQAAAEDCRDVLAQDGVTTVDVEAMENGAAAEAADIVALTVPFAHHRATLESLKPALSGKILIDVTVPLVPPKVARVQLPSEGSAGQIAQAILGDEVRVVSAFQNVAAHHLQEGAGIDCDVLVCGNDKAARNEVIELVQAAGMRGFHAGLIHNAAARRKSTRILALSNSYFVNRQKSFDIGPVFSS